MGPSLLVGANGQGKTNLVEAIGYLSSLGSHRVSGDGALIRAGEDSAVIRAVVESAGREELAEVLVNRVGANRAQLNRNAVRPREIVRTVKSVLFAPEDLALVRGEPQARRRFVDDLLIARSPRLTGVLADYDKALRQRNGLLKAARASRGDGLATLDVWDERLVASGSEILDERDRLAASLAPLVAEQYRIVAGERHVIGLETQRSIDDGATDETGPTAERFHAALARARGREVERAITLVGPHRDDLVLAVNGLPARGYASHGESWSLALALRLASVELLRADGETGDPIVILDDVFAELDETRRSRLAEQVAGYEQVLITAAVEGDVPQVLRGSVIRVEAGTLVVA